MANKLSEASPLERALAAMESVTVFVTSRERINRPTGEDWWVEELAAVRAAMEPSREVEVPSDALAIKMLARIIRHEASLERHNQHFESYVEAKAFNCLITAFKIGQSSGRLALQEAGQSQALEGRENG